MRLVDCPDNKIDTIDHKFMVSGHSYLLHDTDFGFIVCRGNNRFILTMMVKENFNLSTILNGPLQGGTWTWTPLKSIGSKFSG